MRLRTTQKTPGKQQQLLYLHERVGCRQGLWVVTRLSGTCYIIYLLRNTDSPKTSHNVRNPHENGTPKPCKQALLFAWWIGVAADSQENPFGRRSDYSAPVSKRRRVPSLRAMGTWSAKLSSLLSVDLGRGCAQAPMSTAAPPSLPHPHRCATKPHWGHRTYAR